MILDFDNFSKLTDLINSRYSGSNFDVGNVFKSGPVAYLIFDQTYITNPDKLLEICNRDSLGVYIGFIVPSDVSVSHITRGSSFYIPRNSSEDHILQVLRHDVDVLDGPLGVSVNSGYVLPCQQSWAVWFSTFWEVGIASFQSVLDAEKFVEENSHINFMSNDDIVEYYEHSSSITAMRCMQKYMANNLAK